MEGRACAAVRRCYARRGGVREQTSPPEVRLSHYRKLYVRTNDVIASLGGVWKSGKVKAYVFPSDPATIIADVLDAGEYTKASDLAFFETPTTLAERMVRIAHISSASYVLEPSAGEGAIARVVHATGAKLQCFEFDQKRQKKLYDDGFVSCGADFLKVSQTMHGPFDAVVMNPPFSLPNQPHADVEHVTHAMRFLRPGGVLVAVVAGGVLFRSTKVVVTFRETVAAAGGTIESLPAGTFKASGTGVNTALVTFTRQS